MDLPDGGGSFEGEGVDQDNDLLYGITLGFSASTALGQWGDVDAYVGLSGFATFVTGDFSKTYDFTGPGVVIVQGGAGLIKKVQFPHEHLVFSVVVAQFVTMLIEFVVLIVALLIGGNMVLPWLPVLVVIMVLLALFTTGVALTLSAANVFFHDVNYLWGIVAQLLFYSTPIIYDANNPKIPRALQLIASHGPTGSFVTAVRDVMYDLRMPSLLDFAVLTAYAVVAFSFGTFAFGRLSPRFAEEM